MRISPFAFAFNIVAVVVCLGAASLAQSTFGTMLGTVTDNSGAVMPNVQIRITNQGENTSRDVLSDAQGNYEAGNMKEGIYSITVQAAGFREVVIKNIRLTARQIVRTDLKLVVGAATENVTVEANAELVNTESEAISTSITSTEVLNLPANYRGAGSTSPYNLLAFLPGVTGDDYGQISVQGAGVNQVQYTMDGIDTSSVRYSGPQVDMFPSAESISEMKVQGAGGAAEYGGAADITTTSKSGTSQFHGSAFEYFQNAALDALQFGATAGKPAKSANTFGGSIGGPLFGKHTFFFGDYEAMRYRTQTVLHETVPTQDMWNGDFRNVFYNDGVTQVPLYQLDGTLYPNNMIPSGDINRVASLIQPFYPLPNTGDPDTFVEGAINYVKNVPNPILSDQFDIRIDRTINSKQNIFGRWTYKNIRKVSPSESDQLLPAETDWEHDNQIVLAHNYAITPHLINELRGGISRGNSSGTFNFDGASFMQKLGLNSLGPHFGPGGFPDFAFETSGITRIDHSLINPLLSNNIQISENLTWTVGKHTMKFGVDFRKLRLTNIWSATISDDYGDFYFNGQYTNVDFAEFLLGVPYYTYVTHTPALIDGRTNHYYAYAEDSFRASQKLTLDVGVRISRLPPFIDPINLTNFDPTVPVTGRVIISNDPRSLAATQPLFAQNINACNSPHDVNPNPDPSAPCTPFLTAKEAGWPAGLRQTYTDWAPRVGFAYRPFSDNKTVIRGGIGIFDVTTLGSVFYSVAGIHDGFQASYENTSFGDSDFFQFPNVQNGDPLGIALGTQDFRTANQRFKKDPYSIQWNLTVERVLHGNTALRVSYIANRGNQLTWGPNLNQPLPSSDPNGNPNPLPFPNWKLVFSRAGGAVSTYESMQTELIHKYSHGLTFQSTWTWARNLADTESWPGSVFSGEVTGRAMNQYNLRGDYGNVGGTRKHRWITTMVDELPIGKGRFLLSTANGVLNQIVGGWHLSTIFLAQTGPFLTPFLQYDTSENSLSGFNRPDLFGQPNISNPTPQHWFDPTVFACPGELPGQDLANNQLNCTTGPIGRFGNAHVGTLIGPKTFNFSLGLGKSFRLSERFTLKVDSSFTNLPNHVNFDDPGNNLSDGHFGQVTSARSGDAGGSRVGQLALRIEF
ncbi:MAG TPA: carboxypeptidase-like regulatory domain-containing protein [Candidatus Solibacter sp.]|nr:carboxypeptidase-like regulatory domain-containing protein [Candidatus Solibacter sp.]